MRDLYPLVEAFADGMLDVGDGNAIHYEISGAPNGKPAVVLHGGPGQGSSPNMRRAFDPARYRVVLFDQRGCGRSTPHASEPETNMAFNTTAHLVADIERLRAHLGIERWLVSGGSWGSTLAIAYAERHPERVSEIVLSGVTTSRRSEFEWLYVGLSRFFPEAWRRFREHVPEATLAADVVSAYAQRMESADSSVRLAAARAWAAWEDASLSLEPNAQPAAHVDLPDRELIAFVRICARYAANGAWLEEGALIRDASRLTGIPGVLIHGRRDLTCPIDTAWALTSAWPDASLIALDDAGHLRSDSKRAALLDALRSASRSWPPRQLDERADVSRCTTDHKEITMTTDWKNAMTRESILALLTDAEVAKVSEAEGTPLIEGDAYVDLEDVTAGVQQVHAVPRAKSRHVVTKSSLSDATWEKIVKALA